MRCRARPRLTRHFQDNHGRSRAALTSTRQVGTGTQSSYSVPTTYGGAESAGSGSSYGVTGSSNVNVTRYGSEGDSSAGFTSFERDMTSQTQQIAAASALNIKQGGLGFDTGGQIAPGGTQHVEFFKNPNERLIIARPDWAFLDEATSALDPVAERSVMELLRSELPETTFIIVAHREPVGFQSLRRVFLEADISEGAIGARQLSRSH